MLIATVGVAIAQNFKSFAAGDMPSWGHDGEGVVYENNAYSIKLNAKKMIDGHEAIAYGIGIKNESWMNNLGDDSLHVYVDGVELAKNEFDFGGELPVGADTWAMLMLDWNGQMSGSETHRGDAEIEIRINRPAGSLVTEQDGELSARYLYVYGDLQNGAYYAIDDAFIPILQEDIGGEEHVEFVALGDTTRTAAVVTGRLLIERLDEDGEPVEGAKYTIDGVEADNYGGVYYPNEDGMSSTFTTNSEGEVLISGLDFDQYTIREVSVPEGYEPETEPVTVEVNADTMQEETYSKLTLRSGFLELAASGSSSGGEAAQMLQALMMLPGGDLIMHNGEALYLEYDETTGRYMDPAGRTNWYMVWDEDGSYQVSLPEISANIRLEPTDEENVYSYTPLGLMGKIKYKIIRENGRLSVGLAPPSAEAGDTGDSTVSFLKRDDQYLFYDSSGEPTVLTWDEKNEIFVAGVDVAQMGMGNFLGTLTEATDGSLLIMQDGAELVCPYNPETGLWEAQGMGVDGQSPAYIKKDGAAYTVGMYASDGVTLLPFYYYMWNDELNAYTVPFSINVYSMRELEDGKIEVNQSIILRQVAEDKWFGAWLFFPIAIEGTRQESSVLAAKVTVGGQPNNQLEANPESIANPQTSDVVSGVIVIAVISTGGAVAARKCAYSSR